MNKKRYRWIFGLMAALFLIVFGFLFLRGTLFQQAGQKIGLFSWGDSVFAEEEWNSLQEVLETLEITELYQEVSEPEAPATEMLLSKLKEKRIAVYYLTGQAEWGLEGKEEAVFQEIDRVVAYNKEHAAGFAGIVFDIEPYLTDAWEEDRDKVMQSYVTVMESAYLRAHAHGVKLILCIPGWYSRDYPKELEVLIRDCSDEISVMNYNRADEFGSIQEEVNLSKEYEKELACIFEFQRVGAHSLTENETYGADGLNEGKASFDALYQQFGYDGLKFAYHYYDAIK